MESGATRAARARESGVNSTTIGAAIEIDRELATGLLVSMR